MRFPLLSVAILLLLTILITPSLGESTCSTFVRNLEVAFENTNPDLLDWDIHRNTCSETQRYKAQYIQGKAAFYMEMYRRAKSQFEEALTIGGEKDDEILFFLQEIAKETKDKKSASLYADIMQDKFPDSHFSSGSESSDKPWELSYRTKSRVILGKGDQLDDAYWTNQISFQLSQETGDLQLKELVSTGIVSDFMDTTLHSFGNTAEFLLLYKNLLVTTGVSLEYTYEDSVETDIIYPYAWEFGSWYSLFNFDIDLTKRWELGHSMLFFLVDSDYKMLDLTQTHSFNLNREQSLQASFAFEKDFISDRSSIITEAKSFTPELQWIYKKENNKWKLVTEFQWEREELDFLTILPETLKSVMPDSVKNTYQVTSDTYALEGYLSYKRKVNSHFSFDTRMGLGFEGAKEPLFGSELTDGTKENSRIWTPYFYGKAVVTITL